MLADPSEIRRPCIHHGAIDWSKATVQLTGEGMMRAIKEGEARQAQSMEVLRPAAREAQRMLGITPTKRRPGNNMITGPVMRGPKKTAGLGGDHPLTTKQNACRTPRKKMAQQPKPVTNRASTRAEDATQPCTRRPLTQVRTGEVSDLGCHRSWGLKLLRTTPYYDNLFSALN